MMQCFKAHALVYAGDHIVPMFGATANAVHSLLEQPVFILFVGRISSGRPNNCGLVIWEGIITESILTIALPKDAFVAVCLGGK